MARVDFPPMDDEKIRTRQNFFKHQIVPYIPSELRGIDPETDGIAVEPDDAELGSLLGEVEPWLYTMAGDAAPFNKDADPREIMVGKIRRIQELMEKRMKREEAFLRGLKQAFPEES